MADNGLLSQKALQDWTGIKQKKALVDWLLQNGIHFYYTRNGEVCTTQTAVDAPLVGTPSGKKQAIEFL